MEKHYLGYWPADIDEYILFVDESGTENINDFGKQGEYPVFVLCGCLIEKESYVQLTEGFLNIKKAFWPPDGKFRAKGRFEGDRSVCFISSHIRRRKGPFSEKFLPQKDLFYEELNKVISNSNFKIIASLIDKKRFQSAGIEGSENPYQLAFKSIIERLCLFLESKNKKAGIVVEKRGGKYHNELSFFYHKYLSEGIGYISNSRLSNRVTGLKFVQKWHPKGNPYAGVELADLCAYPIGKWHLGTETKAFKIIMAKFLKYPNYDGHGLIKIIS